jgi:hypothetical protein
MYPRQLDQAIQQRVVVQQILAQAVTKVTGPRPPSLRQ